MMNEITVGKTKIKYFLRKSTKARKLKFVITPNNVELVTPVNVEEERISKFVEKKKNWVFLKLNEVNEKASKQMSGKPAYYQSGAKILYRGRMLKLYVTDSKASEPVVEYRNGFYIQVPVGSSELEKHTIAKNILDEWMKDRVRKDVKAFITTYSKKLKLYSKGFRIKDQKHIWGSCGRDNIININWSLIQAPKQILEYVVVHELCHLKYRNHSDAFWALVRSVFPEVDRCKKWLENKDQWEL